MAVPSRVSVLILYTNAESGAYSRDSSQCPQRCPYIFTTIHHRISHDFIESRNCVPMAFTADNPSCPNIITAVLLLYILSVDPFFPPDLCLYKRRKSSTRYNIICCVSKHTGTYYCCTVDPFSPSRLIPAQTSVKSEMNTVQYHPLCPNIVTAVLLLYIVWTGFYPLDLCLSMCKECIVPGTISYVVFKKKLARITALCK